MSGNARQLDPPAVRFQNPTGDVEAQAPAAKVLDRGGALERAEDPRLVFEGDAHALVGDDQLHGVLPSGHPDPNRSPVRRIFRRWTAG